MNKYLIILFTVFCILACTQKYIPKTGDLLFQDLDCGELCDAIEKVTQGIDNANLSHVGIVSVEGDSVFVYEAIGQGVIKTPLTKFMERSKNDSGKSKVLAGRVKHWNYSRESIDICKNLLGRPYDDAFDINNGSYYCSELVYFAFKDKNGKYLFELIPMTFKDPQTGNTFLPWLKYFEELGISVPEGKPGLNPGGISKSEAVEIIYKFY